MDLPHLLKAWKFWVTAFLLGTVLGSVVYLVVPPAYRARATVVVDFNLEEALPQDTDRQHFYYLERETRKMEELAWSDEVLNTLATEFDLSISDLRNDRLSLSQPAEAGWHFYADSGSATQASRLASAWAQAFAQVITARVESGDLNAFIKVEVTQSAEVPVERREPISTYMLLGAIALMVISMFWTLFFNKEK